MELVLHLTDKNIRVIDSRRLDSSMKPELIFGWDQVEAIEDWVARQKVKTEISVVMDFIDETLNQEWVTKLLPWEKNAIRQRFKDRSDAEGAMFFQIRWLSDQRQDPDGRHEQAVMVSTVFGTDGLRLLFDIFEEAQLSIVGVYSYSYLIEKYFFKYLASKIGLTRKQVKRPLMLLLRESPYVFRQVFFNGGDLRISRLIELDSDLDAGSALDLALIHETNVAIKYLYNQKTLPFNSELGFVYLSLDGQNHEEIRELYQEQIILPNWESEKAPVIIGDLFELTGTPRVKDDQLASFRFLTNFFVNSSLPSWYSTAYTHKIGVLRQLRKVMVLLASVFTIALAVYMIHSLVDTFLMKEKLVRIDQKINDLERQKSDLQEAVNLNYDAEDIKASVNFSESLLKVKLSGALGFNVENLSQILERHPNILLSGLKWKKHKTIDDNVIEIYIDGWVFPFEEAYEPSVRWVDQFVEDFASSAGVIEVTLTKEPLDRSLQKALTITGEEAGKVKALPFALNAKVGRLQVE